MDVRRNLFLIFKEAANNMVKYAEADKAYIAVKARKGSLKMLIRDNGRGFDPSLESQGNGLKSMKKRAAEIGGHLEIESAPGAGTQIQFQLAV
jgi:signal transduction histidine kinase